MDKTFKLNVYTPERALTESQEVEAVVLPGAAGQITVLPNHINIVTSLRHGNFGYKTAGEWHLAFLTGGFAQMSGENMTVLAETVELVKEMTVAKAELQLEEVLAKLKTTASSHADYANLQAKKLEAEARLAMAKKHSTGAGSSHTSH